MGRFRVFIIIFIAIVFGLIAYSLFGEQRVFKSSVLDLRAENKKIEKENAELMAKIDYFKIPENLLKESRLQFNFKKQGEKLLIIIPDKRD